MLVKKLEIIPVEVVVRNVPLAASANGSASKRGGCFSRLHGFFYNRMSWRSLVGEATSLFQMGQSP